MNKTILLLCVCLLLCVSGCTPSTESPDSTERTGNEDVNEIVIGEDMGSVTADDETLYESLDHREAVTAEPVGGTENERNGVCVVDMTDWELFESPQMAYTIRIPPSWHVLDFGHTGSFNQDRRHEQPKEPYIAIQQFLGDSLEEELKPFFISGSVITEFERQETTYNDYPAFLTTDFPLAPGAYVAVVRDEKNGRYLAFGLDVWRETEAAEGFSEAKELEICQFKAVLQTLVLLSVEEESVAITNGECGVDTTHWILYENTYFGYSVQVPPSWVVRDNEQYGTLFNLRDFPREETNPYIYTEYYTRDGASFPDVIRPYVSEEIWANFTYQSTMFNNYPAYITTRMPSMMGVYMVFIELENHYLAFGLTPWRGEDEPEDYPGATEEEKCLFEAMLQTIIVQHQDS